MRGTFGGALALAWTLVGCGCGDDPAPSAPTPAPPPPSAPASSALAQRRQPPRPLSREQRTRIAHLVRDARTAETGGDHETALARFDEALEIAPADPRILCESGLVLHRADRNALAAQRIDTALTIYGAPESVPASQRVALARCLFNRGLVDEAVGDPVAAVAHYAASISLRANETVERRRADAAAMEAIMHGDDTMGGVRVDRRDQGLFVHTTDRAELERAMRTGFAGLQELQGIWADPSETEIEVLAERPGDAADPRAAVAYHVTAAGDPVTRNDVVLALPAEQGWQIFVVHEGGDEERNAETWEDDAHGATFGTLGAYVRLDVAGRDRSEGDESCDPPDGVASDACAMSSSETREYTTSAFCQTGPRPRCFVVADVRVPAHARTERTVCFDDDGTAMPVPDPGGPTMLPEVTTTVTIQADGRIRIVRTPPYADDPTPDEPETFDALCVAAAAPWGLTDREHADIAFDSGDTEERK